MAFVLLDSRIHLFGTRIFELLPRGDPRGSSLIYEIQRVKHIKYEFV